MRGVDEIRHICVVPLLHGFGLVGEGGVSLISSGALSEVGLGPRKENILEDRILVDFFVDFQPFLNEGQWRFFVRSRDCSNRHGLGMSFHSDVSTT